MKEKLFQTKAISRPIRNLYAEHGYILSHFLVIRIDELLRLTVSDTK